MFHPPEHFTREGYLRQWLAEGLFARYTIHAKAAGKEFFVEGIDDPTRLPTYQSSVGDDVRSLTSNSGEKLEPPHVISYNIKDHDLDGGGHGEIFYIVGDDVRRL